MIFVDDAIHSDFPVALWISQGALEEVEPLEVGGERDGGDGLRKKFLAFWSIIRQLNHTSNVELNSPQFLTTHGNSPEILTEQVPARNWEPAHLKSAVIELSQVQEKGRGIRLSRRPVTSRRDPWRRFGYFWRRCARCAITPITCLILLDFAGAVICPVICGSGPGERIK